MKKVTIQLHYEPLSVWGYKRTVIIRCGDKSEQEALAYLKSLVSQEDYAPQMDNYKLIAGNVVVEHYDR